MNNKNNKILKALLCFLILLGYYFLNKHFNFSIPCLFHELTNLYCPGCGITRMMFSLIKLDFYQAFRYNPLVFVLFFIYIFIQILSIFIKRKIKIPEYIYYILLIIVFIYWIFRNVSLPFGIYLRPTIV